MDQQTERLSRERLAEEAFTQALREYVQTGGKTPFPSTDSRYLEPAYARGALTMAVKQLAAADRCKLPTCDTPDDVVRSFERDLDDAMPAGPEDRLDYLSTVHDLIDKIIYRRELDAEQLIARREAAIHPSLTPAERQ